MFLAPPRQDDRFLPSMCVCPRPHILLSPNRHQNPTQRQDRSCFRTTTSGSTPSPLNLSTPGSSQPQNHRLDGSPCNWGVLFVVVRMTRVLLFWHTSGLLYFRTPLIGTPNLCNKSKTHDLEEPCASVAFGLGLLLESLHGSTKERDTSPDQNTCYLLPAFSLPYDNSTTKIVLFVGSSYFP